MFQKPEAGYDTIVPSRVRQVPDDFPGDVVLEVWGSDAPGSWPGAPAADRQLCLGQQIRDLTHMIEADLNRAGRLRERELRHVFGRAIPLHQEHVTLPAATVRKRKTRVVGAAERLVFGPPLCPGAAQHLRKRCRNLRDELFVFLDREEIEPTNNSSERDVRNAVFHDKVTSGYRPEQGPETARLSQHSGHRKQARRESQRTPVRARRPVTPADTRIAQLSSFAT